MLVKQYFVEDLAHSSYILAGDETCAIIDPRRDIQLYIDEAKKLGVEITHILETHLHADFVSGHIDLAKETDATIYMPESANSSFEHIGLKEGDKFKIEDMEISILETPGHTPEHISYLVKDLSRGDEPVSVFCGDTLFIGDVGRPDLFPGRAEELAKKLFNSLHNKLLKLPDFCEVYPAHGAGSLCGRAMGAKRTSTIGYEKKYNEVLQIKDKNKFIKELTVDMPPAPDHFSRCSAINAKGPTSFEDLPEMKIMPAEEFNNAYDNDVIVLDVRAYDAFGGQFIPKSLNIDFGGNLPTFAGWVIPPDKDILIVAENEEQAKETAIILRRVGLDNIIGYLEGGLYQWSNNAYDVDHIKQISVNNLKVLLEENDNIQLIDVRAPGEYAENHIHNAINIPAPDLRNKYKLLNENKEYVLTCNSGHRSSLAASIIKQNGIYNVSNLAGGMIAFNKKNS